MEIQLQVYGILLFLLLALVFYTSLYAKLVPQVYDIALGTTSEKTIYAPRQIENAIATEQAKEDAAEAGSTRLSHRESQK